VPHFRGKLGTPRRRKAAGGTMKWRSHVFMFSVVFIICGISSQVPVYSGFLRGAADFDRLVVNRKRRERHIAGCGGGERFFVGVVGVQHFKEAFLILFDVVQPEGRDGIVVRLAAAAQDRAEGAPGDAHGAVAEQDAGGGGAT